MNVFLKLSPVVQALISLCATAVVILAMLNQGGAAALLALAGGLVAIAKASDKRGE